MFFLILSHTCFRGSESISSEVRLRSGISSQMSNSDYQINEQEEWNEIEGIMSSFGSGICRESVFTTDYENKVASFLRDNKVEAITLHSSMSTANKRKSLDEDEVRQLHILLTATFLGKHDQLVEHMRRPFAAYG